MVRSTEHRALEVRVLGPLEVGVLGQRAPVAGTKQRAVLAVLALAANRVVSTDSLIDQIWGEAATPGARRSLQVYVSNLRKILGDAARVASRGGGYVLEIGPDELDLSRFTRLVVEGRDALEQGTTNVAASLFREALDLWRGPPLGDLAFENFARVHIERLEEERLAALEDRIEADLALGRHSQIAPELGNLVAENPLRERLRAHFMLALYRSGRQSEALKVYRNGRDLLIDELGVEPSAELQALERAILDHDAALGAPQVVPAVDAARADLEADHPSEQQPPVTNLPAQLTSFVGRERELSDIQGLILSTRLVTLTGPGGSGKTRLALAVAENSPRRFSDGIWFVDLAPLTDPAQVAVAVAGVLGVRNDGGRPLTETLVDATRDRELLIVMDNCEHVIDCVAKLGDALLRSCPSVLLVATSREPLGISGEHVYRVPTLRVPNEEESNLGDVIESDAVRLFVERVAQHKLDYKLDATNAPTIARVCRRLDGIPLAIELAAAKLRSIGLDELDARLGQRFQLLTGGDRTALPRQRTLRALIDWSWELLTESEQRVLARLAVFARGWDLDAAEAVIPDSNVEVWEVLDLLGALVDKSLVHTDDTDGFVRYRLLETVREYARARLEDYGDADTAAVGSRHRDYYRALAETAAPHLTSHGQTEWLDRLELDHDNLRTALSRSLSDADPEPAFRLAIVLRWFWQFRGPSVEGVAFISSLVDRPVAQSGSSTRGRALVTLAGLLVDAGDAPAADSRAGEALSIGRAERDVLLEAEALSVLSNARIRQGDIVSGLALTDAGLLAARMIGDLDVTTRLLNTRGIAISQQGDNAGARSCYQEARDLCRRTGNRIRIGAVLNNLAIIELTSGAIDAARAYLKEALTIATEADDTSGMYAMFTLGLVEFVDGARPSARVSFARSFLAARRSGDQHHLAYTVLGLALTTAAAPEHAVALHGAADALLEYVGESLELLEAQLRAADQSRLRAELGIAVFDAAYRVGRERSRDDALAVAVQEAGVPVGDVAPAAGRSGKLA